MLLDTAGEAATVAALAALVPRRIAEEIAELVRAAGTSPVVARRISRGLATTGAVTTGRGPWLIVVEGDLTCDHAHLWTHEYLPGLIYVTGKLTARTLSFGNGARVLIGGDLKIADVVCGDYGDHNAVVSCAGAVSARAILLDHGAMVHGKGGVTAVISAQRGTYRFDVDIPNEGESTGHAYFIPAVLDRYRDLDLARALAKARAGADIFKPGVYRSFAIRRRKT